MDEKDKFSLRNLLFGKISKKLGWSFGIMIILLIAIVSITYNLNRQIERDTYNIRYIEAPLGTMVEQVIGYDAILTGNAYASLLHAIENDTAGIKEHKQAYDETGVLLDNLLKVQARELLNQSTRSNEIKQETYGYLDELDTVNLKLVDLELGAFDAMEKGDTDKAYSLIVGEEYHNYKNELSDLYQKWSNVENEVTNSYRTKIAENARNVQIYNLFLGILFILIACIIPILVFKYIPRPINELFKATQEIKKGNFKARTNIKTGDEIEQLGDSFNSMSEVLDKTDEERKQIDRSKTEFLSITSHELRSPMTPMRAQLQMILGNYFGKVNKKQKESLEIVLRNTERLDKIVQDFLEISRIEAARLKFNFVKISLISYTSSVIEEMKNFMPEKKIKIENKIGKLPIMEVDPDRVMQVLRNLVNNAIKFSKDNNKIIIDAEVKSNSILFSVQDFGYGIPKQEQVRIFEPFFQSGGMYQRKFGGTGLGLAICKGIVESQKGKIWFESIKGKGTKFYFTIPLVPVKETAPIKLLFSKRTNIEDEVKKILIEFIGPLGTNEFEDLKIKGITKKLLYDYINELHKNGIIQNSEEFKNSINNIFNEKENKNRRGKSIK